MDFTLPEETIAIRDAVRAFVERELFPIEKQFLLDGNLAHEIQFDLERRARDLGFWALGVAADRGGAGLDQVTLCVIEEELARSPTMFRFGGEPEPALDFCNAQQRERYFDPVVRGERRGCFAFTEPGTGSDFANIKTRAVRDGEGWRVNGSKTFITHVDMSDFIILFASTDPAAGAKGISCFLVDKDVAGLTFSAPIPTMGDGWAPYTLFFDDCYIPGESLLGTINQGFAIGDHQLTHGRLKIAAINVGIAQRCLELAVGYAKERVAFGRPLAANQGLQWMLADSEVEILASRLLVYNAASATDRGLSIRNEAFIAKLFATEMAQRVSDRALQIFGGMGYSREVPIQSFFRQARLWRIGHGTSEIHRNMIARNLLNQS